jgi:hypothetical protein
MGRKMRLISYVFLVLCALSLCAALLMAIRLLNGT